METTLDTLVRLASIGASGVCIFAVFWIGFILRKPHENATSQWHKSMRFYMVTCVLCAVIAGGTGVANAMFNQQEIKKVNAWNFELSENLKAKSTELFELQKNVSVVAQTREFRTLTFHNAPQKVVRSHSALRGVGAPSNTTVRDLQDLVNRTVVTEQ